MRVKTQRLLPGKDCRQQTLSHIDGIFLHESFQRGATKFSGMKSWIIGRKSLPLQSDYIQKSGKPHVGERLWPDATR